ncbi:hypothetical protein [Sphingomonas quercus]|uniref:hypothetical protein n=1 Tax=Sphingomonas quercus TaxID=2842451 RepID=UPI00209AB149|nr:hypothetical protein [Sphingomonas quercus]
MTGFATPRLIALAAACWLAPAALAQSAPPADGDTIRLTDAQRQAILDRSTEDSAARARGESTGKGLGGIHGEVGAMIGSNGTRGIYGTAAIPLSDNAGAIVSFESSRYGYPRYDRRRSAK